MKDSTLKKLVAGFLGSPEGASAEFTALQTEYAAYKADSELQVTELSGAVTSALEAVKQADAKIAELTAQLEVLQAAQAAMAVEAETKRLAARKEKITAAVGTAKADALMEATVGMTDAAFDAVVSALGTSLDAEGQSKMFTEQGTAAKADASKVESTEASGTMLAVKQLLGL